MQKCNLDFNFLKFKKQIKIQALVPFSMFLIYKVLGKQNVLIYTFLGFMSAKAAVSYVIIFCKIKKSNHELRSFY